MPRLQLRNSQWCLRAIDRSCPSHVISGHLRTFKRCLTADHSSTTASSDATENSDAAKGQDATTRDAGLLDQLKERGLINQIAGDHGVLDSILRSRRVSFYCGVDPTAPSLHLGHLLPFMLAFWMFRHGHHVVTLVGGGTVQVGDPTGRLTAREIMSDTTQTTNINSITSQLDIMWQNMRAYSARRGSPSKEGTRELLNNATWLGNLTLMDFLRDMGRGVRIGTLLGRDTVKNKLAKGDGMSFAEFTYPLLQGWDWKYMFSLRKAQIQIGGSDQYGNIIGGIDAIRYSTQADSELAWALTPDGKLESTQAPMGITTPLLTTSSGEKFGKSAGNAVWLDKSMTSPFDLYGFLLSTPDADVGKLLRLFTILPSDEIKQHIIDHAADPGKRLAQHLLASEVLELVHGKEVADRTRDEHRSMRAPTLAALQAGPPKPNSQTESTQGRSGAEDKKGSTTFDDGDTAALQRILLPESLVNNRSPSDILYAASLAKSKSAAARLVSAGTLYAATPLASDAGLSESVSDVMNTELRFIKQTGNGVSELAAFTQPGNLLVLRLGKWKIRIIEVVPDAEYEARSAADGREISPQWLKLKAAHQSE